MNYVIFKSVYYEHEIENVIPLNTVNNVKYLCANIKLEHRYKNLIYTYKNNKYQCINDYVNYYTNMYYIYKNINNYNYDYIGFIPSYITIWDFEENLFQNDIIFYIAEVKDQTIKSLFPKFYSYLPIFLNEEYMEIINKLPYYFQVFWFISSRKIFLDFMEKCLIPFLDKIIDLIQNNKINYQQSKRDVIIHACNAYITCYFFKNFKSKLISQKNFNAVKHDKCHENLNAVK